VIFIRKCADHLLDYAATLIYLAAEATKKTYDLVRSINGPDLYSRYTFPIMGHLDTWLGQRSASDVFPVVLNHLEEAQYRYGIGYSGNGRTT
jgi:hypothetical protein